MFIRICLALSRLGLKGTTTVWQTYGQTIRRSVKLVALCVVSIEICVCLSGLFIPSVQMPVWYVCVCVCVCVIQKKGVTRS